MKNPQVSRAKKIQKYQKPRSIKPVIYIQDEDSVQIGSAINHGNHGNHASLNPSLVSCIEANSDFVNHL